MDRVPTADNDMLEPPRHGYRGESTSYQPRPHGLTVAISREAGARGGSIAKAVGRLLGWQVLDQELLDFLTGDANARSDLLADIPESARSWADARYKHLVHERSIDEQTPLAEICRLTLTLAARGETVLIGRAAGFLLPASSTVHVRIVAPEDQRIAYLGQWLRLTHDEAAAEMARRDARRAELLQQLTGRDVGQLTSYDLLLNSARLGQETCAELIAQTVRAKQLSAESPDLQPDNQ